MSLYDIYNLFINDSELEEKIELDSILNMIEKLLINLDRKFNSNAVISEEEIALVEEIIEKLKEYDETKQSINIINKLKELIINSSNNTESILETEDLNKNSNIILNSVLNFKNVERTDKDLIPDSEVHIVEDSILLFKDVIREETINLELLDEYFNNPDCDIINNNIKDKTNLYTLDKYGLLIRRKCYLKKNNVFAWKFNENNEPIHFFTKPEICNDEENIKTVLNIQFIMNERLFQPGGLIYKVYSRCYPERLVFFSM